MVRHAAKPANPSKAAISKGSYLRVHFKNTHEVAAAIRGMNLQEAYKYLDAVKEHKRAIPFRRFNRGVGNAAQGKEFGVSQARWPVKSVKFVLELLKNAESNAEAKSLEVEKLYISRLIVNQAPATRRRTFRAHGRINPFQSSPCHIQIILAEKEEAVSKGNDKKAVRLNYRQLARNNLLARINTKTAAQ